MPETVVQRVVFPAEVRLVPLYASWKGPGGAAAPRFERRSARLPAGGVLATGTYFNSFFEAHWRRYTTLGRLVLRLRLGGAGTVRLIRRTAEAGAFVLDAVDFDGEEREVRLEAPAARFHHLELGALSFEIAARGPVTLHAGDWLAVDAKPAPVGLVAAYCTFNREPYLVDNLRRLDEDETVSACLRAVVVVDQGTRKVKDHPGFAALPASARARTYLVEQGNFGGAGGFTRSILEAQGLAGADHVLLMDDDAILEPESVLRTARFLALARQEMAVGGNMLDLLRPTELFELNAEIDPSHLVPRRLVGGFPVDGSPVELEPEEETAEPADGLEPLLRIHTTRYNGWWFMAFPLALVERLGLPLPFFIRCDDMEFGCRLNEAGVPVAALPGVGVWHEPFYLKRRGWQNYYEFRNMLVLCALHFPQPARSVLRVFLWRLLKRLLAHDYSEAWLLCEALRDYRRGPALLEGNAEAWHGRVTAGWRQRLEATVPATRHLPVVDPLEPPRGRLRRLAGLTAALARAVFRAGPAGNATPGFAIREEGPIWWDLARVDLAASHDPFAVERTVYRRQRRVFLGLLARGLWSALVLAVRHRALLRQWRGAFARLTAKTFWHRALGMPPAAAKTGSGDVGSKAA